MTNRTERYADFEKFSGSAETLFKAYATSTPESKRLDNLYSLCICPRGRHGGINKKEVEIFYGSRPFDSVMETGINLHQTLKFETAHGATLSYQRTDDGQVLCCLSPAASENYRHPEDFILLGIIKNPSELERKSKRHWKMLLAYMESTCLDGKPSISQNILVFYLRNFKEYVAKETLKKRKASVFFGKIAKYTLTVGLSGFIILLITWGKDISNSKQNLERHQEMLRIYSSIETSSMSIAESSRSIEEKIETLDKNSSGKLNEINVAIYENSARIERAMAGLQNHNVNSKNEKK